MSAHELCEEYPDCNCIMNAFVCFIGLNSKIINRMHTIRVSCSKVYFDVTIIIGEY